MSGTLFYCDAHFHAVQCRDWQDDFAAGHFCAVSCAHDVDEYYAQEKLLSLYADSLWSAFGMHPQNPLVQNAVFLETLLQEKKIIAIGETGFDFFTPAFRSDRIRQEEAWDISKKLAQRYQVPLIVHNRKALDLLFRDSRELSRVPGIIFHSFAFGVREALSLLNHQIDAYFSFGKPLLNGNKKSIACVSSLPLDRILLETDAPFQTLQGEAYTKPAEIIRVYQEAGRLRNMELEELCPLIRQNFNAAYRILSAS